MQRSINYRYVEILGEVFILLPSIAVILWSYCKLDFTFVSVRTIEKPTDIQT